MNKDELLGTKQYKIQAQDTIGFNREMNFPAQFTEEDSSVLIPTGSFIICKSFHPDDISSKVNSNIEQILPSFNNGQEFEATASAMSSKRNVLLIAKEYPKSDIPPTISHYKTPKSENNEINISAFGYKNDFNLRPPSQIGNCRFTHIDFGPSEDQQYCILQGENHALLIQNNAKRENSQVTQELKHTIVKNISVNPNDPLSIAINSNLGVTAYRVENDKFKILAQKFVATENNLHYHDIQFIQVGKNTSVILVLDNDNLVSIFNSNDYKIIDKIFLQDEFSNLNKEYVQEEEKEENIFDEENVNTNTQNLKEETSFSDIEINCTYLKQFRRGILCTTKEGYQIFLKLNFTDLTNVKRMNLFSIKSVLKQNNTELLNKKVKQIDYTINSMMTTLEDGTVFQQNIQQLEAETSKFIIRPMILENVNSKAFKVSISKNKPLVSIVEKNSVDFSDPSTNQDRLVFKNFMDGSVQTIYSNESDSISKSEPLRIQDFQMHISGFMGYSIINNKLQASYILNNGLFNKPIRVSEFKSDTKSTEEQLRGMNWDSTQTKLIVWSNCSLQVVSHESADVVANYPRLHRSLNIAEPKDADLIKVCKFVRGTVVGLIHPNIFFFWTWENDSTPVIISVNPDNMDLAKITVQIEDFFPMEQKEVEFRNSQLLFGHQTVNKNSEKKCRQICDLQFDREFQLWTEGNHKYSRKTDRILDTLDRSVAVDTCVIHDHADGHHYYITGTEDGQLRVYDKIPKDTNERPSQHDTRIHQRAVTKLYYIKEKSNNFIVSLGQEGTIFIMQLNYESRGISQKKNLIEISKLSNLILVDQEKYVSEWNRAKDHLSQLVSNHANFVENMRRENELVIKEKDERFTLSCQNFQEKINNNKSDISEKKDLIEKFQLQLKENEEQHVSNINNLENLQTKKLENERQKQFDLVNLYKDLENKLNIELANQKQNQESERSEILKEFQREFKKQEIELQSKEDYAAKIKSEFKLKEQAIESEHSEEVLWLNKETKRILEDTFKDLKFQKDIASKDKRNLVKSEKEKAVFQSEKEKAIAEKDDKLNELNKHKEKIQTLEGSLKNQEDEIKTLKDEVNHKNAKIKELLKTKKLLSDKANELKTLQKDQWEEKMGTQKKEISEKDQVILENKMEKNKLEDKIKKLNQTKKMFQQYREENLGVKSEKEILFKKLQLDIYNNRMADLAKEQGATDLPNKQTNAKKFIDYLYDTYVGSEQTEEDILNRPGKELFNKDKSEEAVINHITKELDNERQKNQMLNKQAQKTVELKSKENQYLINMINNLRKQVANKIQSSDKNVSANANGSPSPTRSASPTKSTFTNNYMSNLTEDSPTKIENVPMQNNTIKDATNMSKFKKTFSSKNVSNLKASSSKQDLNTSISKGKVVKGATRLTQTGSQKVMESYKWEEMNVAIENHRDMIYKQKSEIILLRDKLDEKDHIIMRLMEQLQGDEGLLNKEGSDDEQEIKN